MTNFHTNMALINSAAVRNTHRQVPARLPMLLLALALLLLPGTARAAAAGRGLFQGKDVIIFLTDEERPTMHFPPGWEPANLPGLTRLKANGLTFHRAHTATCMCSSARSTLLSGLFPAQHGVRYVLSGDNMPTDQFPQVELPTDLTGLASVAAAAGYDVVYKGKLHVTRQLSTAASNGDAALYNWTRWNFPDAGGDIRVCNGAGGNPQDAWPQGSCGVNDERFMAEDGNVEDGKEGALAYLKLVAALPAASRKPFFLVVSLINPHDVLQYPGLFADSGYNSSLLQGPIQLPPGVGEDLSLKPAAQADCKRIQAAGLGLLLNSTMQLNYLNFFGNLIKQTDANLVRLLDLMDTLGLTNGTVVIRTADHGEMAMVHGGERQKMFNMYVETIQVPLIFSNPLLWPKPLSTGALVSSVDLVPTLATLLATPKSLIKAAAWQGVDYAAVVAGKAKTAQDYVVFTFDDFQMGSTTGPYVKAPNHLVAVIEKRYKLAKYYDLLEEEPTEWEMYDRREDPLEQTNLAREGHRRTPEQSKQLLRLKTRLAQVERTRLKSLMRNSTFNVSGLTCAEGGGGTDLANYMGTALGAPTTNSTINVTLVGPKDLPTAIHIHIRSTIGLLSASVDAPMAATGTWTGQAKFMSGTGVFKKIEGSVAFSFEPPAATALCSADAIALFCYSAQRCPGRVSLLGVVKY